MAPYQRPDGTIRALEKAGKAVFEGVFPPFVRFATH